MPNIGDTDRTGRLDDFVESRRQNFREVRLALGKRHQNKAKFRQMANNGFLRGMAGILARTDDLVLVN